MGFISSLFYYKIMSCIEENIVGLSDIDCICTDSGKPAGAGDSLSGLFITDELPLSLIQTIEGCEIPNFWNEIVKQRTRATLNVYDDLITKIRAEYKEKNVPCNSYIGDFSFGNVNSFGEQYQGIKLSDFRMIKGCMILKGISTSFGFSGTIDVSLYSNQSTTALFTETLTTNAGNKVDNVFTTPYEIPTDIEGCDDLEYYFVYDNANGQSKDNNCHCGCSKRKCWEKQVSATGITGNDLTNIESWSEVPKKCNGLVLNIEFVCKEDSICNGGINYDTTYGRNIAKLVNLSASLELLKKLYNSGINSVYDAICKEDLDSFMFDLSNRYDELLESTYSQIDLSNSSCYMCSNGVKIARL